MPIRLTDEQREVVEAEEGSITVTAYAGTGKTSTLKALAASRPKEKILYLAFNKSLAEESRASFLGQSNVEVRTIHSLAWKSVGRNFSDFQNPKALDVLPHLKKHADDPRRFELARVALDAFNSWLVSDQQTLKSFFKRYDRSLRLKTQEINLSGGSKIRPSAFHPIVERIWADCQQGRLPMPHNGYLKLFQLGEASGVLSRYDRILVDEAQDLNDCMIDVIRSNSAKKVLVGDPYQQIYGFNGAVNALAKAREQGAGEYYLTQSFRCPSHVANLANQYLRLLGAPKPFKGVDAPAERPGKPGSLIIARTNAGLFDFVAERLKEDAERRFFYNGGFESYEFETILDVVSLISNRPELVKNQFMRRFKNFGDLSQYAEQARDVALNTRIRIGQRHISDAYAIFNEMRRTLAAESQAHFVTTTAHKIKGREYERVTLLDDFVAIEDVLSQGRQAKSAFSAAGDKPKAVSRVSLEEFRLLYVSVTRSFKSLSLPRAYLATDSQVSELTDLAGDGFLELAE
ncbi:MAG: UvrD-helicase domain-containing protein [Deltaproteobacteria bacterium]|jgi:superfamily I DNA/RNA helicase|nr:UvrD-helicase domain-containing protein [Deltaproteobacteria bacterium]